MSTPVTEIDVSELRATHFYQLYSYLRWAEEEGTYYGQKRYFEKRHAELKEWLKSVLRAYERSA